MTPVPELFFNILPKPDNIFHVLQKILVDNLVADSFTYILCPRLVLPLLF